ncbi:hypothetical protein PIB30_030720 [Stylosanthes scabra]|uniref:Uncharacterized protein n=1 Tax=Stylosanthes scabra TaxID=79078 RepID=A0ABU6UAW5_9FABA|nr:hypothetical protein [Stylosanthes scabra]
MANIPSSLSNAFPLPSSKSPKPHLLLRNHHRFLLFSTRAQSDSDESHQSESDLPAAPDDSDDFENRINQLRVRYRSGTGKKTEARKGRKSNKKGSSSSGSSVFLPPIPLKEPVSSGLKVDFGFIEYSERLNGRLWTVPTAALLSLRQQRSSLNRVSLRLLSQTRTFHHLHLKPATSTSTNRTGDNGSPFLFGDSELGRQRRCHLRALYRRAVLVPSRLFTTPGSSLLLSIVTAMTAPNPAGTVVLSLLSPITRAPPPCRLRVRI